MNGEVSLEAENKTGIPVKIEPLRENSLESCKGLSIFIRIQVIL
jgi:hypothetical protein